MKPLDDVELRTPGPHDPEKGFRYWPAVLIVVLLALALGVYFGFLRGRGAPQPEERAAGEEQAPATPEAAPEAEEEEPLELPELGASDELVRRLTAELSSRPELAAWLASDELILRFAAAVDNIAEGRSPRRSLSFLAPDEGFSEDRLGDRLVVDPASYERYDAAAAAFASLDTAGTARLYRQLKPLIQEAYRDLGYPRRDFDETLKEAIGELLRAPVVEDPVELRPQVRSFEYANPRLEALSPAQKHLLRMGPENARRVQAKLAELARALGFDPVQLRRG